MILIIISSAFSSYLLTSFSFPPSTFYHPHASLEEVPRLPRRRNFPGLPYCPFHRPEGIVNNVTLNIIFMIKTCKRNRLRAMGRRTTCVTCAWISVIIFARSEYSSWLSKSNLPASSFKADSGFGTISKHFTVWRGNAMLTNYQHVQQRNVQRDAIWFTNNICCIPRSGFQSFFNVLTHISPFFATLGWNIFVRKYAFGGPCGKSFPRANFTLKKPLAYGVPAANKNFMFQQLLLI